MTKELNSGADLRQLIVDGVNILADNVATTLGPKGRNVIIQTTNGNPIITKDGVTVAQFLDLENPFKNAAVQVVKQASAQTNSDAGDGTTTSTVLSRALLLEAQEHLSNGACPVDLKRGMDLVTSAVVEDLKSNSRPVMSEEDVRHIATISANGDETIGTLVSTAADRVGKNGSITIEEARSNDTTLDLVEGFRLDSGYAANAFITDERRGVVKYEDPMFLITDSKIETVDQILPSLEIAARESRPFIIVADEIEGQALAALIMNAVRGTMKVAAVKSPRYGEERRGIMSDLALATGASYITKESDLDLKTVKMSDFGSAKSIEIGKRMTTIVDGSSNSDQLDERIQTIKAQIEQTESIHECERMQERITRLASGVAVIRVGAPTEIEMIEKKHRIEDALEAVRSAQMEGIVPGGGLALYRTRDQLKVSTKNEDQDRGVEIVLNSLSAPIEQMAKNAGFDVASTLSQIDTSADDFGLDFSTGDIVNMHEAGIIDPVKVTRCALQNAVSVVGTLITTDYAIIQTE